MEFTDYKCPVCGEQFKNGDDIVVCPECGAPHHRECYEKEGHCRFEDKHKSGYTFDGSQSGNQNGNNEQDDGEYVKCKGCGSDNPKECFYCAKCGAPLYDEDKRQQNNTNNQNQNQGNMPPFGMPFGQTNPNFAAAFDPMAGMKSDELLTEGVTAGEAAKFVGKSTQYYLRVFGSIQKFSRSRFNFAAFLLTGIFFLYRKMYVLGGFLTAALFGLTVGSAYIMTLPDWQSLYQSILSSQQSGQIVSVGNFYGLSAWEFLYFVSPVILNGLHFVLMIVCGLIANRSYFKNSAKKIRKIKASGGERVNETLTAKGGVNLPIAAALGIAFVITSYIPMFF